MSDQPRFGETYAGIRVQEGAMTEPCPRCDGDGWVEVFDDNDDPCGARTCDACDGTGIGDSVQAGGSDG